MPVERYAVLKSPRDLVTTLLLCRDDAFLIEPCTVIHSTDGDEPGPVFFRPSDLGPIERERSAPVARADVDESAGTVRYGTKTYAVLRTGRFDSVYEALDLEPWAEEPRPDRVLVRTGDRSLIAETITRSLRLGSDELAIARASTDRETGENGANLFLRMDAPSYFLIQQLAERDAAGEIEMYHRVGGVEVYLPWGSRHPLEARIARAAAPDGLVFIGRDRRWNRLASSDLRDVYESLDIHFEKLSVSTWAAQDEQPRFSLTLRFSRRPHPADPELWVLGEDQLPRLENILTAAPEKDLSNILLSIQADARGNRRFFVRELITGRSRRYLDIEGLELAAYEGYTNLYVPVDRSIEPQIRKDRYRELLDLRPRELTLLVPAEDFDSNLATEAPGRAIKAIKIDEAAFRPIAELVDYRIGQNAEALGTVVSSSVFDFARYEVAEADDKAPKGLWARFRAWLRSRRMNSDE